MQDKESDGSTKTLVEMVARAICFEQKINPDRIYKGKSNTVLYRGEARAVLTAIKEAGYAIIHRDLLNDEQRKYAYRAMITAGEE